MKKLLGFFSIGLVPAFALASTPLFTLTPLTPTNIQVATPAIATVQYLVQNQSNKVHTLVMQPITGVTQLTTPGNCPNPFTLGAKQVCILTLQVSGTQVAVNSIHGGPVVCQENPGPLQCYRPAAADILNATHGTIFYSGTQSGSVYSSTNGGVDWTAASAQPGGGTAVNSVFATNVIYAATANGYVEYSSDNGATWTSTTSPDGSSVNSVFATATTLYVGTGNGNVFYSTDNGNSWTNTNLQPDGSAVNSIFVTANGLYVGTGLGYVYYSADNGTSWASINGQPDGSAVMSVYIAGNTVYTGTANEYVYSSTSLTGGGSWTAIAQTVYSLFVNTSENTLYAGTQGGYVFSLTNGVELGFVTYSPINSLYMTN